MRQIRIEGQNNGIKDNKSHISRRVKSGILAAGMIMGGAGIGAVNEARAEIIMPGEMLSQKRSALGQIDNSAVNEKSETTTGLGVTENDKKPEQIVAEDIVGYLNSETPHTDEEIKYGLFIGPKPEKIVDLGLIKYGDKLQGRFLGYLETDDKENLLLFIGLKDRKQDRFVTALRLALYVYENENLTHGFRLFEFGGLNITSGGKMTKLKDKKEILFILDSLVGKNVAADLVTEKSENVPKNVGSVIIRLAEEINKVTVNVSRSLAYDSFSNGIKLDYSDPKKKVFTIKDGSNDEVTSILSDLVSDNKKVVNVPIIPAISYR